MNPFEGQILKPYDDNDSDDSEDRYTRQRYIEAVTGSTFVIRIMFTNKFKLHDLKHDDGVAPWLNIDGGAYHRAKYISRNELDTKFLKAEPGITEFSNVPHFREETGQWMESKFVLADLADKKYTVAQAKDLGEIRITVRRCRFETRCKTYESARLAVLERGLNIKAEPPDGSAGVRAEGPSNLKHEREEDENLAPRQRRQTSVTIETVDLTEG
ncbi:hypothetical protein OEA41_005761 [Lepraria neglecta]|uniref:DUF7918 domain-containing protein n=1 Tax=Lepraria neglecta TaxID=209136 RepID=A0AAD9Z6D3_9LECA|nr:hypothetical protein OEA41_005761 [Lepraria neglecta]